RRTRGYESSSFCLHGLHWTARKGGSSHRSGLTPRGTIQYASTPTAKSTSTASSAVGIAPASIMPGSFKSMPVKISSPKPPPPIRNASGAVPTLTANAVRMPANVTNNPFGRSTHPGPAEPQAKWHAHRDGKTAGDRHQLDVLLREEDDIAAVLADRIDQAAALRDDAERKRDDERNRREPPP